MVCAVVCTAPDTMPSAMSSCAPSWCRNTRRRGRSRAACSTVMPLCVRSSAYSSANWSHSSLVRGLSTVAADRSTPSSAARARICGLLAEDGQVGHAALQQAAGRRQDAVVVALGQHDVLAVRAGPVEQLVLEHQRRDHRRDRDIASRASRSAVSTWRPSSASAVSILRCEVAVTRPRADATPCWPSRTCRVGGDDRQPQCPDRHQRRRSTGAGRSPPLRMMQDSDGKPSAAWALTTASTTSERSPGVMTATPSRQPLQHVLGGHRRPPAHPSPRACSSAASPLIDGRPRPASCSSATEGATSSGSSGST